MAECVVGGVTPEAIITGSITVPASSTGTTVNLGGVPKFFIIRGGSSVAWYGNTVPPFAFPPTIGLELPIGNPSGVAITFTATGFYVSKNSATSDFAYDYFAIM